MIDIAAIASQAGQETGEVFPGDTPWRRRFAELLYNAAQQDQRGFAQALAIDGMRIAQERDAIRNALAWYAEPSNWKREVRDVGPRINWIKPPAAFDRGARAKLTLMTLASAGEKGQS